MNREDIRHDKLEGELRRALKRTDAPEGFAERVLERVRQKEASASLGWWARVMQSLRTPVFATATAAALCLAVLIGSLEYRRHQVERARGEAAKQQLMVAVRLTGTKLHYAQKRVNEIGQRHGLASRVEE